MQGVAEEKAAENLLHRGVEHRGRDERDLQRRVVAAEHRLMQRVDETEDGAVLDHHAFRHAGRTGGIDHVRQLRRIDRRRQAAGRVGGDGLAIAREELWSDHHVDAGIPDDRGTSIGRMRRIERHVRGAGFEHGQQRHDQVARSRQAHAHARLRTGAERNEVARQLVRTRAQLGVGEPLVAARNGNHIGRSGNLFRERAGNGLRDDTPDRRWCCRGRRVERNPSDGKVGRLDRLREDAIQARRHPRGGARVEDIRVVFELAPHATRRLFEQQREIELRGVTLERELTNVQSVEGERRRRQVLQHQRHLKHRRHAKHAFGRDRVHDLFERHVLVSKRVEGRLANAAEQLGEGGRAGAIHAQRQVVRERADQPLELPAQSIGRRGADDDLVLPGIAMQQHGVPGQQHHEEAGLGVLRELLQPGKQRSIELEPDDPALVALLRRPRPIERQLDRGRRAGQLPLPVAQLGLEARGSHGPALEGGVVRVLNVQLRQGRPVAANVRRIERRQLAEEHPHRPAVGDEMVKDGDEDVLALTEAQQLKPDQRLARREIEDVMNLLRDAPLYLGLSIRVRQAPEIDHRQPHARWRIDDLHRAIATRHESRPEDGVPADDFGEAPFEGIDVERAGEGQRRRHVVRGAGTAAIGAELVQKPEPLLRERKWCGARRRARNLRRGFGARRLRGTRGRAEEFDDLDLAVAQLVDHVRRQHAFGRPIVQAIAVVPQHDAAALQIREQVVDRAHSDPSSSSDPGAGTGAAAQRIVSMCCARVATVGQS